MIPANDDRGSRLLADIGGTNARFALVAADGSEQNAVLRCQDHRSPAEAARAFLAGLGPHQPPRWGAFAVAAPVLEDRIALTNLDWSFSIAETESALGLERLTVVNDFTAVALAVPQLGAADTRLVGSADAPLVGPDGRHREAPVLVLGPGSGLGVATLVPSCSGLMPLAGEGGHVTIAATDAMEAAVLARLRRQYGHVSAERVVSGPGLVNLYQTLAALEGAHPSRRLPVEITQAALAGSDPLCVAALDLFYALLGTVAADAALTVGARGGVYLAGGILPRLGDHFLASRFRARFETKGRLSPWLAAIPTRLITHPLPAFLGLRALAGPAPLAP
jgi:glucokinase